MQLRSTTLTFMVIIRWLSQDTRTIVEHKLHDHPKVKKKLIAHLCCCFPIDDESNEQAERFYSSVSHRNRGNRARRRERRNANHAHEELPNNNDASRFKDFPFSSSPLRCSLLNLLLDWIFIAHFAKATRCNLAIAFCTDPSQLSQEPVDWKSLERSCKLLVKFDVTGLNERLVNFIFKFPLQFYHTE